MPLPLQALLNKKARLVAGLMSGTSLDGVDAVVARLEGSGTAMTQEVLGFVSVPYPREVRDSVLAISDGKVDVRELSQINALLPHVYADAIKQAARMADMAAADLDLIGSHGQTIHHVPDAEARNGYQVRSSLQIGDGSVLANLLGVPVVSDFRTADMALGGQGAPLVPYFDYIRFADPHKTRVLLNIGGIANLTALPAGGATDVVIAFDTGPGNMVVDQLVQRYFDVAYDAAGAKAAEGVVIEPILQWLLEDPYYRQLPPKSTGREQYGAAFVDRLIEKASKVRRTDTKEGPTPHDLLATATALTASSIASAYHRFIGRHTPADEVIVSGGGQHNRTMMEYLEGLMAPVPVRPLSDHGIDPDAKEALCFAVLAHEYVNGVPTSLPAVTGASAPTLLGKLCLPFAG